MNEVEIKKILNIENFQSVRHLIDVETTTPYAIYITNRFRKIGWISEIDGKHYGQIAKLQIKEKDDIIDAYLAIDDNAKKTIKEVCKK